MKNDVRYLANFHKSSRKSEKLHFDGLLLSKAYNDLCEKVQKSYISRHWRVMQSLRKNWLLVRKMTWGIWWILILNLKICTLMCYFCQWHMNFQLKKYRRIVSQETELKTDPNFEEKLTFCLTNDMKNWVNFNKSSGRSENLHFDGLLL